MLQIITKESKWWRAKITVSCMEQRGGVGLVKRIIVFSIAQFGDIPFSS
jgi:hypothetical protein